VGQIVVAIECALRGEALARDIGGRQRAIEVFSQLRVWDTERNNGVLLYILFADRDVEIVADRGVARLVPDSEWRGVCEQIEARFRAGEYTAGTISGVIAIAGHLGRHFPPAPNQANELSDSPVLL
jgi:uncharacterized membrane protein